MFNELIEFECELVKYDKNSLKLNGAIGYTDTAQDLGLRFPLAILVDSRNLVILKKNLFKLPLYMHVCICTKMCWI